MNVSASNAPSSNGSSSRVALDEPDPIAEPRASSRRGLGQHLGALVEADDPAARLPSELERDGAGAGRDVEHRVAGPASIRETRKRRQRGSWPNESRRLQRS